MISAIRDAVVQERHLQKEDLRMISFHDWFTLLEARANGANERDVRSIPAIKLLEFFRRIALVDVGSENEVGGIAKFSTEKVQEISPTIRNVYPVQDEDARMWVKYWNSAAMFE